MPKTKQISQHLKKKPIIFVHGIFSHPMTNICFEKECLQHPYYKISFPGHNAKPFKNKDVNFFGYVKYLEKFILENKLENIIIIGHSMGGGIALLLNEKIKSRISKLILVTPLTTAPSFKYNQVFYNKKMMSAKKFIKKRFFHLKKELLPVILNNLIYTKNGLTEMKSQYEAYKQDMPQINLRNFLILNKLFWQMYFSGRKKLRKITFDDALKKYYLICGNENDFLTPNEKTSTFLEKKFPNLQIQKIDHSGHLPMFDNPSDYKKYL